MELMMASAIASLLGIAIAITTLHSLHSFRAISNYSTNEQESRTATDWLSRDIRRADAASQTADDNLTLSISNKVVSYTYDAVGRILIRKTGNERKIILNGCSEVVFTVYQENSAGAPYGQFTPGTNMARLIKYYWHCGATNNNGTINSTDAQSALVVMRN